MEKLIYGTTDLYYVGLEEGDKCPVCGNVLRPIAFFAGDVSCERKKLERSVMDDHTVRTETYGKWVKCWGGYCSHCAESYQNDEERLKLAALLSLKKLSIFMILSILGLVGFFLTGVWGFQLLLFVGLFGLLPFALMTLGDIAAYLSRKPYEEPTEEELQNTIVSACNSRYNRGTVSSLIEKDQFFTPEEVLVEEN